MYPYQQGTYSTLSNGGMFQQPQQQYPGSPSAPGYDQAPGGYYPGMPYGPPGYTQTGMFQQPMGTDFNAGGGLMAKNMFSAMPLDGGQQPQPIGTPQAAANGDVSQSDGNGWTRTALPNGGVSMSFDSNAYRDPVTGAKSYVPPPRPGQTAPNPAPNPVPTPQPQPQVQGQPQPAPQQSGGWVYPAMPRGGPALVDPYIQGPTAAMFGSAPANTTGDPLAQFNLAERAWERTPVQQFMDSAAWTQGMRPDEVERALQTIAQQDYQQYSPEQQQRIRSVYAYGRPAWMDPYDPSKD